MSRNRNIWTYDTLTHIALPSAVAGVIGEVSVAILLGNPGAGAAAGAVFGGSTFLTGVAVHWANQSGPRSR